ncbi:hypothetical protein AAY77_12945, partial [Providencia rettgeri]
MKKRDWGSYIFINLTKELGDEFIYTVCFHRHISCIFVLFSSVASSTTIIDTKKEPDVLDLVFILDKSGSMSGFETDTIGGYNSVLTENKGKKA